MKPAAATSLDVAVWFLDRARIEDSYLQARKLQCLLFLAQAHFIVLHKGRRLMPSVFLFDEGGPMEPNVYRVFENGHPNFMESALPDFVLTFLDAIWRRYGGLDTLRLDQLIARQGKGEPAIERRDGSEVGPAAMRRMFATTGRSPRRRSCARTPESPSPSRSGCPRGRRRHVDSRSRQGAIPAKVCACVGP